MIKKIIPVSVLLGLFGCTHLKNLASPFRSYSAIKTSLPWDSIKVRTEGFAAQYGWIKTDSSANSLKFSNVYFYDVSLGETCDLTYYMSNDSLHAKLNPCANYDSRTRQWGRKSESFNDGVRQAFLTQAYYKSVDPKNPAADSLLRSNPFPKITTKKDIEAQKTNPFDIIDKYITE